jgi:copper chaperone NosL
MKITIKTASLLLLLTVVFLSGCGQEKAEPVAINENTDKCDICNMAVSDNQFATQIILENGKSLVFDDIGCMHKWLKENEDQKVAQSFVRDYDSKQWIEEEKATFVYDKSLKTPMAYNVISFIKQSDAKHYVEGNEGTLLLTPDELNSHTWERNKEMMKMKMDSHNEEGSMEMEKSDHTN